MEAGKVEGSSGVTSDLLKLCGQESVKRLKGCGKWFVRRKRNTTKLENEHAKHCRRYRNAKLWKHRTKATYKEFLKSRWSSKLRLMKCKRFMSKKDTIGVIFSINTAGK